MSAVFMNISGSLDYSRVEIAEAARPNDKKTMSMAERVCFLFSLFAARFWGIAAATIEDLAFEARP